MAYDRGRSDGTAENDLIAVGGTGFGIMAMLVAVERGWISRRSGGGPPSQDPGLSQQSG